MTAVASVCKRIWNVGMLLSGFELLGMNSQLQKSHTEFSQDVIVNVSASAIGSGL